MIEFELKVLLIDIISYFFFSGLAYFIFYILYKRVVKNRIIQKKFEKNKQMLEEIKYSMSTIIIFTLNFGFLHFLQQKGYTKYYSDVSDYGIPYLIFSAILMIIIHDTYFYWGHRFMHLPKIYRHVHLVHHKSTNPSPFAAYYFHPIEAFIEIGVIYVVAFLIPYHEYMMMIWWIYMVSINVMGHLSVELFPADFLEKGILKWHNSAVHHNMHHKYFNYNYGLFFNVWDRVMGTVHPDYYDTFEEVTTRGEDLKVLDFFTPESDEEIEASMKVKATMAEGDDKKVA